MRKYSILLSILTTVALTSQPRASECWISNLPGNFETQINMAKGYPLEVAIFTWRNLNNAPGVTSTCTCKDGSCGISPDPTAYLFSGSEAKFYVFSDNPHYKIILDQMRFAKANGLSSSIQTTVNNPAPDANYGGAINIIITR